MKKTLVLLLAVLFLMSALVPFTALAAEAEEDISFLNQSWIPTFIQENVLIFALGLLFVLFIIALIVKNKVIY